MVDAIAEDYSVLATASVGGDLLEAIVERIDMTMILPPVTVKFPHNVCELKRVLKKLENEGLTDSKTARSIAKDLELRKKELPKATMQHDPSSCLIVVLWSLYDLLDVTKFSLHTNPFVHKLLDHVIFCKSTWIGLDTEISDAFDFLDPNRSFI